MFIYKYIINDKSYILTYIITKFIFFSKKIIKYICSQFYCDIDLKFPGSFVSTYIQKCIHGRTWINLKMYVFFIYIYIYTITATDRYIYQIDLICGLSWYCHSDLYIYSHVFSLNVLFLNQYFVVLWLLGLLAFSIRKMNLLIFLENIKGS